MRLLIFLCGRINGAADANHHCIFPHQMADLLKNKEPKTKRAMYNTQFALSHLFCNV